MTGRPAEQQHRAVRLVARVGLHVVAGGKLVVAFAVHAAIVSFALVGLPSGLMRGSASWASLLVSWLASLPMACMLQIFRLPERSLTKTIVPLSLAGSILPVAGGSFGFRSLIPDPRSSSSMLRFNSF